MVAVAGTVRYDVISAGGVGHSAELTDFLEQQRRHAATHILTPQSQLCFLFVGKRGFDATIGADECLATVWHIVDVDHGLSVFLHADGIVRRCEVSLGECGIQRMRKDTGHLLRRACAAIKYGTVILSHVVEQLQQFLTRHLLGLSHGKLL